MDRALNSKTFLVLPVHYRLGHQEGETEEIRPAAETSHDIKKPRLHQNMSSQEMYMYVYMVPRYRLSSYGQRMGIKPPTTSSRLRRMMNGARKARLYIT